MKKQIVVNEASMYHIHELFSISVLMYSTFIEKQMKQLFDIFND